MGNAYPKILTGTALNAEFSVGRLVGIDGEGRPLVLIEGDGEYRVARSLVQVPAAPPDFDRLPDVAIAFEGGDRARPLIVGWIHDRLVAGKAERSPIQDTTNREAVIDGQRVTFRAENEIVLECGASSIVLTKDGHIVIKGAHVVSRSSGVNKIKGATVSIN